MMRALALCSLALGCVASSGNDDGSLGDGPVLDLWTVSCECEGARRAFEADLLCVDASLSDDARTQELAAAYEEWRGGACECTGARPTQAQRQVCRCEASRYVFLTGTTREYVPGWLWDPVDRLEGTACPDPVNAPAPDRESPMAERCPPSDPACSSPMSSDAGASEAMSCRPGSRSEPGSPADPCTQNLPQCAEPMYAAVTTCMPTGEWNSACQCVLASDAR